MGLQLDTGLGFSAFSGGYPGASTPTAAGATAQGPTSIGQKAFGITTGAPTYRTGLFAIIGGGGFAIAALVFMWWSLPR